MMILGIDVGCVVESLGGGEIPDKDCLLPLLSKVLGYCIVAASTTVKLPQILKILKHQSVRGLSTLAFELEVLGYTIALAYCLHKQLPFSAYGELLFLLIQALILVAVIYYFSQPSVGTFTWIRALIYCAVAPTVLAGNISPVLFEALYASQHAVFFCARVPQIWQNFKVSQDAKSLFHSRGDDSVLYLFQIVVISRKNIFLFLFFRALNTIFVVLAAQKDMPLYIVHLPPKNKGTGELSLLTSLMNFAGSMVRVFTSLQEKAPTSVVMGSVIGIFTNGTILTQILVYGNPRDKEEKKKN